MPLSRIIYSSQAAPGLGLAQQREILERARHSNEKLGITGILLYCEGRFVQAIEGERSDVSALFQRISADRRHLQITLIDVSDEEERLFGEWEMKFVSLTQTQTRERAEAIRGAMGAFEKFDPDAMSSDSLRALLVDLSRVY